MLQVSSSSGFYDSIITMLKFKRYLLDLPDFILGRINCLRSDDMKFLWHKYMTICHKESKVYMQKKLSNYKITNTIKINLLQIVKLKASNRLR